MRSKARTIAIVEALALLLGSGLLIYAACREETPDAARESRVFSAARTRGASAAPSGSRAALEETIGEWLRQIATGRLTEESRAELQNQLNRELADGQVGKETQRNSAAGLIVQQMFDQAKARVLPSELTVRQALAIEGMSRELTRQLLALASGSSPGADSIQVALPPGHERVDWKRLGGFSYQQGAPLPADITALGDREVGLPGFMLSLGETDQMSEFVLVESLWGCCFGSVPDVNQTVLVRLAAGQTERYTTGPILVTGTLRVGEERQGAFVTSLYRIENARVAALDAEGEP
jgi:hypothetical protein